MRHFTPEEANRTLPLVKRIVADILAAGRELRELVEDGDREAPQDRIEDVEGRLRAYLEELHQIGCSYKDWGFELGLIDFPARLEGQDVLLCWRSDEQAVTWFHTRDGGFAGRRPIPSPWPG